VAVPRGCGEVWVAALQGKPLEGWRTDSRPAWAAEGSYAQTGMLIKAVSASNISVKIGRGAVVKSPSERRLNLMRQFDKILLFFIWYPRFFLS
jgi:hypothetical protein